jgi:hypothetical protein
MASPLISAARTDLQDMEKKTNKVHLPGGKKKKKKRREDVSPLRQLRLVPVASHTKTIGL